MPCPLSDPNHSWFQQWRLEICCTEDHGSYPNSRDIQSAQNNDSCSVPLSHSVGTYLVDDPGLSGSAELIQAGFVPLLGSTH
ncbi:hypothetical protein PS1_027019 [Malus domestica]